MIFEIILRECTCHFELTPRRSNDHSHFSPQALPRNWNEEEEDGLEDGEVGANHQQHHVDPNDKDLVGLEEEVEGKAELADVLQPSVDVVGTRCRSLRSKVLKRMLS
jgi:hypothetical protein